jgi:hypothetical protein
LPHTENGLPQRHRHALTGPEEHPAQPATGDGFAGGRSQQPSGTGAPVADPATGLPQRVRQASLAAPLRSDPPDAPDLAELGEAPVRPPEEVRRKMASYQLGTVRGRLEAETLAAAQDGEPGDAPEQEREPAQPAQPHADRGRHAPQWSGPAPGDR